MNPPHAQSITDLLLRAARLPDDTTGLRHCPGGADLPGHDQSYARLLADARGMLAVLRRQGLRPQDKVVLILERPQDFLTAFWASVLGGFVPCPLAPLRGDPDRWAAQLAHVDRLLEHPLVVTSASLAAELPRESRLSVATYEELAGEADTRARLYGAEAVQAHHASPDDPAVLVLTSGSTGNSKAVILTHGNLLASMRAKNGYHRLTPADTTLNWVSFDHVAALLECHLLPLSAGSRQLHVEPAVILGEPLEFLRLVSRHRVTMTFTPNFLLGHLNAAAEGLAERGEELDLSALRHIVSGGEAVVRTTGETFLAHYARYGLAPGALWPAFGMTETCAGSVYSRSFPHTDRRQEFASLGTPVDGLLLRVTGPGDRPLGPGEVGELQLKGPVITPGYYRDEEATQAAFTADGWFRSGDLGRLDEGRLTLVGRSKDSVIVNGVNYFSHDIECELERLAGVTPSFVAAFPMRSPGSDTEQLVIAFCPEDEPGYGPALYRILASIRSSVVLHWGFRPALILPLPREAFPKTSLGKIQRALMRHRLEAGEYAETVEACEDLTLRMLGGHVAPEGATEKALARIYAETLDVDPSTVSATVSFFDLGGTSLEVLQLRGRVTRRLKIPDLPLATVLTSPTVRGLAARIDALRGGRPTEPEPYDPVVPMQESGAKTPLFCVHPGVGEVLVFVNLATYFAGDRPFYALRARGFDRDEKPFVTFDQMVDRYVQAIRERQPHGPYALAGYSFGAAVAFEIAKVLESEGERVDFVGSFNLPPHIKYRMRELDFTETAVNLAFFMGMIDKHQADQLPAALSGRSAEEVPALLMALAPAGRLRELDVDEGKFATWAEVAHRLTDLGRDYDPAGTVRSLTVFCAEPLRGTREEWLEQRLRRWDDHSREPNRYVDVAGEHYTLMGPRHVAGFQAVLRRELDAALADADRMRLAGTTAPLSSAPEGENA
ncbi:non-ribosomal peptide synthetase [Streptomyces sp. CB03234]|uniref:non-ribosomal peptide synthetase n=1 Tax=Streptomyces sp. (strain CB03234) TaxID=1703937 RepID=UPI000AD6E370|nr:non-ribosomal peptide synthetase [Streptomyces sp. CB03234]